MSYREGNPVHGGRVAAERGLAARIRPARALLPSVIVAVMVLASTAWFSAYSIALHDAHLTHKADLGQIDQAIWNTAHGRWLQEMKGEQVSTRLTDHAEPIFVPVALVFWLWDDVRALLVLQALALSLAALPIYLLARARLRGLGYHTGAGWAAAALAAAYLLAPAQQAAAVSEFHAFGLAPPLVAWAFWAAERRQWRRFMLAAVLVMAVQEGLALLGAILGLYVLVRSLGRTELEGPLRQGSPRRAETGSGALGRKQGPRRWTRPGVVVGAGILLAGLVWFYATTFVIIPHFAAQAYGIQGTPYAARYGQLGDSIGDVLKSLLLRPGLVMRILAEPLRVQYLLGLLAPTGFLALLAPEILLLSLPLLLANALSTFAFQYAGMLHYSAPLAAYFALAGALGLARLLGLADRVRSRAGPRSGDVGLQARPTTARYSPGERGSGLRPDGVAMAVLYPTGERESGLQPDGVAPAVPDASAVTYALDERGSGLQPDGDAGQPEAGASRRSRARGLWLTLAVLIVLACATAWQVSAGYTPLGRAFWLRAPGGWPVAGVHERLLDRFLAQAPSGDPGSASSDIFPHVAQRARLYEFPTIGQATWALVDVSGTTNRHPRDIYAAVSGLLTSGWGVVDAADGYLLLAAGRGAPTIPAAFYDFARAPSARPQHQLNVTFGDGLRLFGYDVVRDPQWRRTTMRYYWQALSALPADTNISLQVVAPDGEVAGDSNKQPLPALVWYPPSHWQPGEIVVTSTDPWYLPAAWAPLVTVSTGSGALPAAGCRPATTRGDDAGSATYCLPDGGARLADTIKTGRAPAARPAAGAAPALFGGSDGQPWHVALASYAAPESAAPGQALPLRLTWTGWDGRLPASAGRDYTLFVHLRRPADGTNVASADATPAWYVPLPTSQWAAYGDRLGWSTTVDDQHTLLLPAGLAPGRYTIVIGWYDWQTGARLQLVDEQGNVRGEELVLGDVQVSAAAARQPDLACLVAGEACASQ